MTVMSGITILATNWYAATLIIFGVFFGWFFGPVDVREARALAHTRNNCFYADRCGLFATNDCNPYPVARAFRALYSLMEDHGSDKSSSSLARWQYPLVAFLRHHLTPSWPAKDGPCCKIHQVAPSCWSGTSKNPFPKRRVK